MARKSRKTKEQKHLDMYIADELNAAKENIKLERAKKEKRNDEAIKVNKSWIRKLRKARDV